MPIISTGQRVEPDYTESPLIHSLAPNRCSECDGLLSGKRGELECVECGQVMYDDAPRMEGE